MFQDIRGVIADMDGVIWRDAMPLPGAVEFFQTLRGKIPYVFATNNPSHTVSHYVDRLARIDIFAEAWQIISSGVAAAAYLAERYPPGTLVYVVGHEGLRITLQEYGFVLTNSPGITPEIVIASIDRAFDYAKLKLAMQHIRRGAAFIGTNSDTTFPVPGGLAPGGGSILAAIEAASGVAPQVIGKPARPMYEIALRRLKTRPEETLMIGDRLETDIQGAALLRMKTALMLSGVSTDADIMKSEIKPDCIFDNLAALLQAYTEKR